MDSYVFLIFTAYTFACALATIFNNLDYSTYSLTCDVELEKGLQKPSRSELQCKIMCIRQKCLAFYFDEDLEICYMFGQNSLENIQPYKTKKDAPTIKVINLGNGKSIMPACFNFRSGPEKIILLPANSSEIRMSLLCYSCGTWRLSSFIQ